MAEPDTEQSEETTADAAGADTPTAEAPAESADPDATADDGAAGAEAAGDTDDADAGAADSAGDDDMAAAVDQRAGELTGESAGGPGLASGSADPIAQAEDHIASLDMDEERKKVDELTKGL
jgi:hypothetical protein